MSVESLPIACAGFAAGKPLRSSKETASNQTSGRSLCHGLTATRCVFNATHSRHILSCALAHAEPPRRRTLSKKKATRKPSPLPPCPTEHTLSCRLTARTNARRVNPRQISYARLGLTPNSNPTAATNASKTNHPAHRCAPPGHTQSYRVTAHTSARKVNLRQISHAQSELTPNFNPTAATSASKTNHPVHRCAPPEHTLYCRVMARTNARRANRLQRLCALQGNILNCNPTAPGNASRTNDR